MHIGTIDFYHFIPFSLTLTSPGGHKVSAKKYLLPEFFPTLFVWSGWNFMWWWSSLNWTSWDYFWVGFIETREITAVLQTVSKTLPLACIGCLWNNLIQTRYDDRFSCTLCFAIGLIDWPWFKVTEVQESKNFCASYLTKFSVAMNGIGHTVDTRWYDELHIQSIFSIKYSQEENPAHVILFKNLQPGLHSDIDKLDFFFQTLYNGRDH